MNILGDRLKELRKENGLNQAEFGDRIGISMSAVSLLEKGTNNPSELSVRAICSEFGVRREWLVARFARFGLPRYRWGEVTCS